MRKRILCLVCALVVSLGLFRIECAAAVLDPDRECSLTVSCSSHGTAFSDLQMDIFRVAELNADGEYQLLEPFASYPIQIHGITSQQEWQETAQTIKNYIAANHVEPYQTQKTNGNGDAIFTGLETGLYMVKGITAKNNEKTVIFRDFMVYLPTPVEDGYDYDMEAKPKFTEYIQPEKYTVIKLWKDAGASDQRPKSILVDIWKDGVVQESVVLNGDNNWSYSWEVTDKDGEWGVIEKNVPDGYKVSIAKNQTSFVITNSKEPATPDQPDIPHKPTPDIPKTGDTFPLLRYVIILCVSGLGLVAFAVLRQKDKNNEKK